MSTPVEKVAAITVATGSGAAFGGGVWLKFLADNHQAIASLGIIVGGICAVLGLIVTVYYKHKAHKHRGGWID